MKYFSSRFALSLTSQLTGDLIEKSVLSWIYFFQVHNYNKSQDDFSALLIVTWLLQRSLLPILLLDTAIGSISLPNLLCFICSHPPTTWISLIIQPSELHLVSPFYPILLFYNFTSKLLKNSQEFLPQNRYLHKFCRSNYISILFRVPTPFCCCFVQEVVKYHVFCFQREVLFKWKKNNRAGVFCIAATRQLPQLTHH